MSKNSAVDTPCLTPNSKILGFLYNNKKVRVFIYGRKKWPLGGGRKLQLGVTNK